MDWPLSGRGSPPAETATFMLGTQGVRRRLGVKALLVFTNILTMLYKKFAGLTG